MLCCLHAFLHALFLLFVALLNIVLMLTAVRKVVFFLVFLVLFGETYYNFHQVWLDSYNGGWGGSNPLLVYIACTAWLVCSVVSGVWLFSESKILSQLSIGDSTFWWCHTFRKVPIQCSFMVDSWSADRVHRRQSGVHYMLSCQSM